MAKKHHPDSSTIRGTNAPPPSADRFHPNILSFEHEDVDEEGGKRTFLYRLRDDLVRLARNQHQLDADGTVFFCARILEITASRAVEFAPDTRDTRAASRTVCGNLNKLTKARLLPPTIATWAHSLRHMGNATRHLRRPITTVDAELATAFLEGYLHWFFCEYEFQLDGYRSARLLAEAVEPPAFATSDEVARLVRWLGATPPELDKLLESSRQDGTVFLRSPVFATLTAEKLLAANRPDDALEVLEAAIRHEPSYRNDDRLRQMMGLYHSRTGALDDAERWLTGGTPQFESDPETVGILGGVYKRRYQQLGPDRRHSPKAKEWLRKAGQTYKTGWERSGKDNFYLGINAAATALWDFELREARAIAGTISHKLGQIRQQIVSDHPERRDGFDLWDELTLLEADLIQGRYDQVRASLDALIDGAGKDRPKDIAVFLEQARRNMWALREFDETELPEDFLERPTP